MGAGGRITPYRQFLDLPLHHADLALWLMLTGGGVRCGQWHAGTLVRQLYIMQLVQFSRSLSLSLYTVVRRQSTELHACMHMISDGRSRIDTHR